MEKETDAGEYVKRIVTPIFRKALQEGKSNPRMVGRVGEGGVFEFLWQPHNYRLYFGFDRSSFRPPGRPNPTMKKGGVGFSYSVGNYGHEHHFDKFMGCRVVVRKNQVEVINKWHGKQWRLLSGSSVEDVDERIDSVVGGMDGQCLAALRKLIDLYGGSSDFRVLRRRGEHGIHGIDFLDRIDPSMVIHDSVGQKLYKKKFEFFGTAALKNTISNHAVGRVSPEIAEGLSELAGGVKSSNSALDELTRAVVGVSENMVVFGRNQEAFARNIEAHLALINEYRKEVEEFRLPFFVRWWRWLWGL